LFPAPVQAELGFSQILAHIPHLVGCAAGSSVAAAARATSSDACNHPRVTGGVTVVAIKKVTVGPLPAGTHTRWTRWFHRAGLRARWQRQHRSTVVRRLHNQEKSFSPPSKMLPSFSSICFFSSDVMGGPVLGFRASSAQTARIQFGTLVMVTRSRLCGLDGPPTARMVRNPDAVGFTLLIVLP
jgi:hypothetical protein